MNELLKKPTAWIPLTLSLLVLVIWGVGIATNGAPHPQPDEGTGARLFQLWLGLEVLLIFVFAILWLPRRPKYALFILLLQIIAALAACAPVVYFKL